MSALLIFWLIQAPCAWAAAVQPPAQSGNPRTVNLEHRGRVRTYSVYIPSHLAEAKVPAVLVLHGGGGNGKQVMRMTGFHLKAEQEGFIAVFPDGTASLQDRFLVWNAGHCCASAMRQGVDDVGFIRDLIQSLVRDYPVDPERIFVTGISNGAMMAHRLGRELSDLIAAIAPVAGGMFGDEKQPARPVSALLINGGQDTLVPVAGGKSSLDRKRIFKAFDAPLAPASFAVHYWTGADGCASGPVQEGDVDRRVAVDRYEGCREQTEVVFTLVEEIGHAWPGGAGGRRENDGSASTLDATTAIWDFFKGKRKQIAPAK